MTPAMLPDGDRLLKLAEVAQLLRNSIKTVRRMIESKELPSLKIRGVRLVRESAVMSYVKSIEQSLS